MRLNNMKVYLFSLNPEASVRNQWDFGLLKSIFDDLGYDYSRDYDHFDYGMEQGIVVIPARHHVGRELQINAELAKLPKVKLILIGDEEGQFNVELIDHPNIEITVQNPNPQQHDKYKRLGTGYPKHFLENKPTEVPKKDLDFYFAGQSTYHAPELVPPMNVNHRRQEMADQLEQLENGKIVRSKGFTQGSEPKEYYADMARAKVAPCPSGPELPDTFRLFEALELGCVPIVDERVHKFSKEPRDYKGYWEWFFGEPVPFPIVQDFGSWKEAVKFAVENYPDLNNKCQAWWYQQKDKLKEDLTEFKSLITVVIPVSPIKSHPSTTILDETIASIRHHMPKVKIIVSFDGVREEQADLHMAYVEHIRRVLYKYPDIYPVIFGEHRHQSGMMTELLERHIHTPMIMYVEQDTPLEKEPIDFGAIFDLIESGESNLVRFHHESSIPPDHEHMMLGLSGDFMRTVQWSQRPHIASSAFYRQAMAHFSENSKSFIEDLLHGVVWNAYLKDGKQAYNQWRLHIYHPDTGNIRRSYHTDGRQGAEKYDDTQKF